MGNICIGYVSGVGFNFYDLMIKIVSVTSKGKTIYLPCPICRKTMGDKGCDNVVCQINAHYPINK